MMYQTNMRLKRNARRNCNFIRCLWLCQETEPAFISKRVHLYSDECHGVRWPQQKCELLKVVSNKPKLVIFFFHSDMWFRKGMNIYILVVKCQNFVFHFIAIFSCTHIPLYQSTMKGCENCKHITSQPRLTMALVGPCFKGSPVLRGHFDNSSNVDLRRSLEHPLWGGST